MNMKTSDENLEDFFGGAIFKIPSYQRAYAWEEKHCRDLWEDVRAGLSSNTEHYLGTIVLRKAGEVTNALGDHLDVYEVVDGQQRLTTLVLFMVALYSEMDKGKADLARGLWLRFVQDNDEIDKLTLGRADGEFFKRIVQAVRRGECLPEEAERASNRRLLRALRNYREWIRDAAQGGGSVDPKGLAEYARKCLKVGKFVTENRTIAIKLFETVNDRGKPLSLLEKTKSFLMFHVSRFGGERTENALASIDESFGIVFDNYDKVRDMAQCENVSYLTSTSFNEDEFLRYAYHYGWRKIVAVNKAVGCYEYDITPERIFSDAVKGGCEAVEEGTDTDNLERFIRGWCEALVETSTALVEVLQDAGRGGRIRELLRFQGPRASVYPLMIGAQAKGILDEKMLEALLRPTKEKRHRLYLCA